MAMRFSVNDESIYAFLNVYDALPEGDKNSIPWEAVAIKAGLDMRNLLGAIMFAVSESSVSTVKIIALTSHPVIMKKTAEFAQLPGGERDRTSIHQALGFLPSPKGPTFIGKAVFGPGGGSGASSGGDDEDDDKPTTSFSTDDTYDQLFPSTNTIQQKLVPIRQKLLSGS